MVDRARELRDEMSPVEALLWTKLRSRQVDGLKFRRQHPLEPYVLDFYCPEVRLAVEIDGDAHLARAEQDAWRDRVLLGRGIRTLRIGVREVYEDLDAVLRKIKAVARGG